MVDNYHGFGMILKSAGAPMMLRKPSALRRRIIPTTRGTGIKMTTTNSLQQNWCRTSKLRPETKEYRHGASPKG